MNQFFKFFIDAAFVVDVVYFLAKPGVESISTSFISTLFKYSSISYFILNLLEDLDLYS